jgi:hypothetical protein
MPCFTTVAERREYYRRWFATEKGMLLRKRIIVARSIQTRRCPSRKTLDKYCIEGDELRRIFQAMQSDETRELK